MAHERVREMEEALRRVRGVVCARVVPGPGGEPAEVHVMATPERSPRQVARDAASVLMTLFRIPVDLRRISVAQTETGPRRTGPGAGPHLFSVEVRTSGEVCQIRVRLRAGDALYEGTARGPDTVQWRPRLAATATLAAVEELTGGALGLELDEIRSVSMGPVTAVVVSIFRWGSPPGDWLLGSSVAGGDEELAAARAVMDAVRRIPSPGDPV
ncbi:MAG: hypothetical protein H0Z37_07645 [Firmicutes bacterium]|nr:hypothetical protein [Bacillota bacterium]